jgi:hypothetical protein
VLSQHDFIARLVHEEIDRLVRGAAAEGGPIKAAHAAAAIVKTYANCGLLEADIANEVMMNAARKGVAVEFGEMHDEVHGLPESQAARRRKRTAGQGMR